MIATATLVAALVTTLVATNWPTVRAHVEAWHFQLTRETKTVQPLIKGGTMREDPPYPIEEHLLHVATDRLCAPVIFDPNEVPPLGAHSVTVLGGGGIRALLEKSDWRVIEQRFPRRAYVLIRGAQQEPEQTGSKPEFNRAPGPSGTERP